MRAMAVLVVALTAAACGRSGMSFNGTIHGNAVNLAVVNSSTATLNFGPTGKTSMGVIVMSSDSGMCSDLSAKRELKDSQSFSIILGVSQNGVVTAPTGPSSFVVTAATGASGNTASVGFSQTDATCSAITADSATGVSGTVTLTSVVDQKYSGSFDVMMDSGDHITGSFDGTACGYLLELVAGAKLTCI